MVDKSIVIHFSIKTPFYQIICVPLSYQSIIVCVANPGLWLLGMNVQAQDF